MKVKIFSSFSEAKLEKLINDFIADLSDDEEVEDIKFIREGKEFSAMIIIEED